MMNFVELLGFFAAACTTSAWVPQLSKIVKTHGVKEIALGTFLLNTLGCTTWAVYGAMVSSAPLLIANILTTIGNGAIVVLKIMWDKKNASPPKGSASLSKNSE